MGLEGNHDDVNDGQEVRQAEVEEPKNEVDDQQIRDSLDSLNTLEPQTTEGTSEGGGITEGMTESESEVTEETPIEHAEKLEGDTEEETETEDIGETLDKNDTLESLEESENTETAENTEIPGMENVETIDANEIDMTYARGMEDDHFWEHHGNTKEDYTKLAEKLPDVQEELANGKSLDELKENPEYKDTINAYYNPDNMVKVEKREDGTYEFQDDGRHRVKAAQEAGAKIPVEVVNRNDLTDAKNNAIADDLDSNTELDSEDMW